MSASSTRLTAGMFVTKDAPCPTCSYPFEDIETPYNEYTGHLEKQINGELVWQLPIERNGMSPFASYAHSRKDQHASTC